MYHLAKWSDDDRDIRSRLKYLFERYLSMVLKRCIVHFLVGQESGLFSAMHVRDGGTKLHVFQLHAVAYDKVVVQNSGNNNGAVRILTAKEKFIRRKSRGTKAFDNSNATGTLQRQNPVLCPESPGVTWSQSKSTVSKP
ncbi:hypothetical protein PILCRDRAFT_89861 [Piloderma croceum F 1598]|uniref:Uncharacterized protein n=1 Tax=Piloderma croceum (strain F 1598) TaxID=765440 RepID=A0A0C3FJK2_PILCF|nr:hypothetical protein PILCRDRAFT_89861 [Piloderma croceum F 1598]